MGLIDWFRRKPARTRAEFVQFAIDVCGALEPVAWVAAHEHKSIFAVLCYAEGDVEPSILDLETVWRHVQHGTTREQQEGLTREFDRMVNTADRQLTWVRAQALLYPSVRQAVDVEPIPGQDRPVWRPFLPGLVQVLALRAGHVAGVIRHSQLKTWAASEKTAWASADHNLAWLMPPVGSRSRGKLFKFHSDRIDAASYLGCRGWLAAFGSGEGSIIAWCSDRDTLNVFTVDSSVKGTADFEMLARLGFQGAKHPISPLVFTIDREGAALPLADDFTQLRRRGVRRKRSEVSTVVAGSRKRHLELERA